MPPGQKREPDFLSIKVANKVRSAWNAGRRKVVIGDREFKLTAAKGTTLVAFSKTDKRPKGKRRRYILVQPADGSPTPMAHVEKY